MYKEEVEFIAGFIQSLITEIKGLKRDNVNLSMQLKDCSCKAVLEHQAGTPLSVLNLSPRALNCLKRKEITCVEDLAKLSDTELYRTRNLGKHTLQEIKDALEKYVAEINRSELTLKGDTDGKEN
jgi:DNA-directed RNA polymerase alpha subunit